MSAGAVFSQDTFCSPTMQTLTTEAARQDSVAICAKKKKKWKNETREAVQIIAAEEVLLRSVGGCRDE